MHIPDGYLSPATCAALYAASAPFWYVALKRLQRLLLTRLVPLISIAAAFSFVVMMFNLPLPGGTSGHASGAALAAIVLGPWGAIIAISMALILQALFFGDGGILAIGANCFNIAVVGSLVAYASYRLLAGRAPLTARRRMLAAGASGYLAINAAALLTAIELGIQPMLFKTADGVPLYAPFPLAVAIPAMMLGHLTLAGLAEAIVTAGVVAYLQRSDVRLLQQTAPGAPLEQSAARASQSRSLRPLWIGLLALALISPLGMLTQGTAWGEWGSAELVQEQARHLLQQAAPAQRQALADELAGLAATSGDQPAAVRLQQASVALKDGQLDQAALVIQEQLAALRAAPPLTYPQASALASRIVEPVGLQKWSSLWTAPIPDYAPAFLKSESAGYIISALVGLALVIAVSWLISRLLASSRASW